MKSKLTLKSFFAYVFSDKAAFDKHFPAEILAKKLKEKREDFAILLENSDLSRIFRVVLRQLNAELLEKLLFHNATDTLSDYMKYNFPKEEKLEETFIQLNNQYGYFTDNIEETLQQFVVFYKACKLQADYIELNNDYYNFITVPALHAYKMLVLFGFDKTIKNNPFRLVEKFMNTHDCYSQAKPLHDTLVLDLPNQTETKLISLDTWQLFIQKHGIKALSLFQMAPAIEEILQRAPSSLQEAIQAAGKCRYKRYEEYSELADLCLNYHVKEQVFNQCLEIEPNRKKTDNLPTITIKGEDIGYPDYYFLKLPLQDPRAYILGQITNCCQSIGGHSEICVIDGITRANNGFYVIVKRNKKAPISNPLLEDGSIDYQHFSIVGQAYAWISIEGNLTFDSWENLRKTDDLIAVQFLKKFSQVLTETSDILRVTIGIGGNTPKILAQNTRVNKPEKMLEGKSYSDSNIQTTLYLNVEKVTALIQKLQIGASETSSDLAVPASALEIQQFIYDHDIFSSKQLESFFKFLVRSNPAIFKVLQKLTLIKERKQSSILFLDSLFERINMEEMELNTLAVLLEEPVLTAPISSVVKAYLARSDSLKEQLQCFREAGIYTKSKFWLLENNLHNSSSSFKKELMAFLKTNIPDKIWDKYILTVNDHKKMIIFLLQKHSLLTDENYQLLDDMVDSAFGRNELLFTDILVCLNNLVTQEIFDFLIKISLSPDYLNHMYLILVHMKDSSLLTAVNLNAICNLKNFLYALRNDFINLSKYHLFDSQHFSILIEAYHTRPSAYDLSKAWIALHKKNILNDENRNRIMKLRDLSFAETYADGMIKLHDHGLLNDNTTEIIKRQLNLGAENHIEALIRLDSLKILNNDLCSLINKFDKFNIDQFIRIIVFLKEHNISNQHTCKFVYNNYYKNISYLPKLYEIGFLTEENQGKMLIKLQTTDISWGITQLYHTSLLTEKNIQLLLTYPKEQFSIVNILSFLKKTHFSFELVLKNSLAHFDCIYKALILLDKHHPVKNFKELEFELIVQTIAKLQEAKLFSLEMFNNHLEQKPSDMIPLTFNFDAEKISLMNEYLKDIIKTNQLNQNHALLIDSRELMSLGLSADPSSQEVESRAMADTANHILNSMVHSTAILILQTSYEYFNNLKLAKNPTATHTFFGLHNPGKWQEKVHFLRMEAWTTLLICLKTSVDDSQKLSILKQALAAPLFKDHRSNFVLTGAFGDTYTIKMIRELEDFVLCRQRGDKNFNTFGI